jgi:hypothetical protein
MKGTLDKINPKISKMSILGSKGMGSFMRSFEEGFYF